MGWLNDTDQWDDLHNHALIGEAFESRRREIDTGIRGQRIGKAGWNIDRDGWKGWCIVGLCPT
jgi:hypothetical protein